MSEFNSELDDEFESFDDEDDENLEEPVSDDDDNYDDDDTTEARRSPRNQNRPNPAVTEFQTKLDAALSEVADYKKRLGDQVRINGERRKAAEAETDEWFKNADAWLQDQARTAAVIAYQQAVKDVEDRLLDKLLPEEKSDYLVEIRRNPLTPPTPQLPKITNNRQSSQNTTEDVSELVSLYEAKGVPLDKIEQTSAKAVVESAQKWLDEEKQTAIAKTERRVRDESGATRVSSGGPGVRTGRADDRKSLDRINEQLRSLRGKPGADRKATPLLRQKKVLESRLRSRRAA